MSDQERVDDKEAAARLLTALTTEQFVLQSTRATVTGEAGARASLYVGALSSALVALAFAGQFEGAFAAFAAAVLPAILVLGVFTYVRLAEIGGEDMQCLHRIQRIRGYYRTLSPQAASFFPTPNPGVEEGAAEMFQVMGISPRQRLQFLFTVAAMVAAMNSIVAGVSTAMLLDGVAEVGAAPSICGGVVVALVAMTIHMVDERHRYARVHAAEAAFDAASRASYDPSQ
jgi:fatty acid desaturase